VAGVEGPPHAPPWIVDGEPPGAMAPPLPTQDLGQQLLRVEQLVGALHSAAPGGEQGFEQRAIAAEKAQVDQAQRAIAAETKVKELEKRVQTAEARVEAALGELAEERAARTAATAAHVEVEARLVESEAAQRVLQARMAKVIQYRSQPSPQAQAQASVPKLERMLEVAGEELEESKAKEYAACRQAHEAEQRSQWAEERMEQLKVAAKQRIEKQVKKTEVECTRQLKLMALNVEGERCAWESDRLSMELEVRRCKAALGEALPVLGVKVPGRPPPARVVQQRHRDRARKQQQIKAAGDELRRDATD